MITLRIGNSLTQVSGLDTQTQKRLKTLLSYTPDNFFAGGYPRPKYLLDSRGFFPTGLVHRVQKFLTAQKQPFTLDYVEKGFLPAPAGLKLNLGGVNPYPDQLAAVKAAKAQGRGIISMPTGTGKSLVIALIAAQFNVRTLVVVPTLEIKKQLLDAFKGYFGPNKNIVVENIDSSALQKAQDFDLLIVDEAHHVASDTYQKLNRRVWTGIRWRFFLTATPFRNQVDEQLLFEGIAGQLIYQLSYKDAVKHGYIVPLEAYYLELPKIDSDAYSWAEVYKTLVTGYKARNDLITTFAGLLEEPTLILVKEVAHGKRLAESSGIPFVHGQDEESRDYIRQFNKGEIKALIGTTGVIGEGVDSRPCEWVIIAGLGKAKSAFMQQVGRAVRRHGNKESAKILIFKDKSHKFTLRHFAAQVKILKDEYGVTPIQLTL